MPKLIRAGVPDARDRIWAALRAGLTDIREICRRAKVDSAHARSYLRGLALAGIVERKPVPAAQPSVWTLVRDCGAVAPRITRDGKRMPESSMHEQLWRTMPILREFDAAELALAASTEHLAVNAGTASHYICALHRVGYMIKIPGYRARYRLLRSMQTGPRAPRVAARGVWDANLGQWLEGKP